jgi:hypothetical protein
MLLGLESEFKRLERISKMSSEPLSSGLDVAPRHPGGVSCVGVVLSPLSTIPTQPKPNVAFDIHSVIQFNYGKEQYERY